MNAKLKKQVQTAGFSIVKTVLLIVVALLLASVFLALSGYDPMAILEGLYQSFTQDIAGTIRWSTAMVLAGLAVCVCYKAGIANLQPVKGCSAGRVPAFCVRRPSPLLRRYWARNWRSPPSTARSNTTCPREPSPALPSGSRAREFLPSTAGAGAISM